MHRKASSNLLTFNRKEILAIIVQSKGISIREEEH